MSKSKNPKRQKLRNNEYYDFQNVQDDLYARSQKGFIFKDLMSKIISETNILLAYRNIKKNTGSKTKGTDGKTIAYLAKLEPKDLILLVRRKLENYQPQKVRRVEIPKYMEKSYGKSKQLRFVYDRPLLPIGYIQHQWGRQYKGYSPYIASDREQIHQNQKAVDISELRYLIENPIQGQSVEYNDNRISLFVGQYGKCYVTEKPLILSEMHCHHKKPRALNGSDEYKNLVLLSDDVHRLVHSTKEETIKGYTQKLNLTTKMLEKVNKLRKLAKLNVICN